MNSSTWTPLVSGFAAVMLTSSLTLMYGQSPLRLASPPGLPASVPTGAADITGITPQPLNVSGSGLVLVMPPGATSSSEIFKHPTLGMSKDNAHRQPVGQPGGNIPGLISAPTFTGEFAAQAGGSAGQAFRYTIVGNDPVAGHTTQVNTHLVEVSLILQDSKGAAFRTVPYAPFEDFTLQSPNFANAHYTAGNTQFGDAFQRAEFFNAMDPNWHTQLQPEVVDRVTITVPASVTLQYPDGSLHVVPAYFWGTAPDGSTFVLMLDLLFNYYYVNVVVNEINAGNFQPDGFNTALFPNTFLYSLNVNNPQAPGRCCVLGFHTYFYESGVVPQPRWLSQFASWISPGLFGGGFQDVTALSHELQETFNDPFLDNGTALWQFPGQPANSTACQGNLEVGDPIEVLSNGTYPVNLNVDGQPFTYHPQNMALLQWFEMGASSNALGGAFSYPNTSVLTQSAVPCP